MDESRISETGYGLRKDLEGKLRRLVAEGLVSEKDAETIRDPKSEIRNPTIGRAAGCIGMCISMGSSGPTI